MRRMLLLLAVAALLLALPASPVFAQAGEVEGLPEGECPSGGDWELKKQELPPGSAGEVTLRNETDEQCFHELENFEENPVFNKETIDPWPPEIQVEDNTQHNKKPEE